MDTANTIIQFCLGIFALLGILFAGYKFICPKVKITILAFYPTALENGKIACVLKLKINSQIDLIHETLYFSILAKSNKYEMKPFMLSAKGFLPKMKSLLSTNPDSYYKLIKPIEPNLQNQEIKSGVSEYYVALKSIEPVSGFCQDDIIGWNLKTVCRPAAIFIPDLYVFKKDLSFDIPFNCGELEFDTYLLQKISDEEFEKIKKEL